MNDVKIQVKKNQYSKKEPPINSLNIEVEGTFAVGADSI